MRKKVLMIMMAAVVAAGLCACGKSGGKGNEIPSPEVIATTAPTQGADISGSGTGTGTENIEPLPITDYSACVATTKLPANYLGIEVKKVTDEDVDDYIAEVLAENMTLSEVDRAVEKGDVVDIDYAGYLDGVAFDGGTGNIGDLEIGSGSFIDGFEDGLIGMKKGEHRSLPLTFPEAYHSAELAGKSVIFEVTLNSVSVYELPAFDDTFVSDLTSEMCTTTAEFREYVYGLIKDNREYDAVIAYMLENTEFGDLNEEFIQANLQSMKDYYEMYAQMYGLDLDTFMLYYGVPDAAAFWKDMEEELRKEEKERILLYCVAKNEGVSVSTEEFNERVAELAESYDMTVEEFLAQQDQNYVEQSIFMERGLDVLLENVITVE